MSHPVQVRVQQRPQNLSIVPDATLIKHSLERIAAGERDQIDEAARTANAATHGGPQSPGAAPTPGFSVPAATPNEKRMLTAFNNLLDAFYNNKITGDQLASNKMLALQLEQALQWEQRFYQLMSNISKLQHETLQGIIGNIRG